jgi:aspartyl-tRNA(Asn)/glutamyl-tRNA(Gln) amidotransferase subunit B
MEYESVIGLEVHVQLLTKSKMFCSCRADYQAAGPNTAVCPVCLGMPGVLPVINKKAVQYTITTGLALNCQISNTTKFDRKNYTYPDLMKGYQISQFDCPIATMGYLDIELDGIHKQVGITRVHLEEDVAKLQHVNSSWQGSYSLVDVNRAGVPLMEVVSEPDMRSADEAREYLTSLHSILQYIGVSTAKMQEGSFRCDTNVSIRPFGTRQLGTKVEVKNLNSFRAVYNAINHEVDRQARVIRGDGSIVQETRGWSEEKEITFSQRTKEYAHDYRFFAEPDLPPLVIQDTWVEELRTALPELPQPIRERFINQYSLSHYDADLLTTTRDMADFFESAILGELSLQTLKGNGPDTGAFKAHAKTVANLILSEVNRLLKFYAVEIGQSKLTPGHIGELAAMIESDILSPTLAKIVLEEAFASGQSIDKIIHEGGYVQISDKAEVESVVTEVIDTNPKAVADYLNGKQSAAKYLVGQVMKLTKGKANPTLVDDLVKEKLGAMTAS